MLTYKGGRTRSKKPGWMTARKDPGMQGCRPHVMVTEAQTLEQAVDILIHEHSLRKRAARIKAAKKERGHSMSLRQIFSCSRGAAAMKVHNAKHPRFPPKSPHPYKDLPEEAKGAKAMEMYESGHWGTGSVGAKRIADAFGVTMGQAAVWLEGAGTKW